MPDDPHAGTNLVPGLPRSARYALSSACVLSQLDEGERMTARAIAERTGIPPAFLAKVLRQLVRAEILNGTRGHGGGFRLARAAGTITLGQVVAATRDDEPDLHLCPMGKTRCRSEEPCSLHDLWTIAAAPLQRLFETVTVADLTRC